MTDITTWIVRPLAILLKMLTNYRPCDILFIRPPDGGTFRTGYSKTESVGIEYLCAVLEENGISSGYLDFEFFPYQDKHFADTLKRCFPKIIGLSINYSQALTHISSILDVIHHELPGAIVIAGGQYVSMAPEIFIDDYPSIKCVLRFESEPTITGCVKALLNSKPLSSIPNIVFKEKDRIVYGPAGARVAELDALPFPHRPVDIVKAVQQEDLSTAVSGSRGCWWGKCKYCALSQSYINHKWIGRTPENIADEVAELFLRYGFKDITFVDAEFLGPPARAFERARAFTDAILAKQLNISYAINLRPENATPKNLEILKKSGLSLVYIGIESAAESHLKRWGRGSSPEVVAKAVKALDEIAIPYRAGFILFDPFSTLDDLEENINFLIQYPIVEPSLLVKGLLIREGLPHTDEYKKQAKGRRLYDDYFFDPRTARFINLIRKSLGRTLLFIHRLNELNQKNLIDYKTLQASEEKTLRQILVMLKDLIPVFREKSLPWLDDCLDEMVLKFAEKLDSFITESLIPLFETKGLKKQG